MSNDTTYVPQLRDFQNEFTTYDLGSCAALICEGYTLLYIDQHKPKKALFIIERDDKIEQIARKYWRKELSVDALTHFEAIKYVKNRLHDRS